MFRVQCDTFQRSWAQHFANVTLAREWASRQANHRNAFFSVSITDPTGQVVRAA